MARRCYTGTFRLRIRLLEKEERNEKGKEMAEKSWGKNARDPAGVNVIVSGVEADCVA